MRPVLFVAGFGVLAYVAYQLYKNKGDFEAWYNNQFHTKEEYESFQQQQEAEGMDAAISQLDQQNWQQHINFLDSYDPFDNTPVKKSSFSF